MEQKEYPVGSRFQVDRQWYEVKPCVDGIECTGCCFNSTNTKLCECKKPTTFQECVAPFRKDNANVYFVKIDPPTDMLDTTSLTREIGSIFYYKGVKLQVCEVPEDQILTCGKTCYFHNGFCSTAIPVHGLCGRATRSDGKHVYFKEVKDEEQ